MTDEYLVDILMCVYNQEKFVAGAIEGIIHQKTNFGYRLLIGEDNSTDNSRQIVKSYADKFPNKIVVFFNERNVGANLNSKQLFENCKSPYIALCDGDDYWTNFDKLQKQVDFLEANSEYEGVSCNVFERVGDKLNVTKNKSIITFGDLANGNSLYTCSVLFRNGNFQIHEWFYSCKMGDWILWLLLASKGPIFNMDDVMCVYRIHGTGTWSGKSTETNIKDILNAYEILLKNIKDVKQRKMLANGANQYYIRLLRMLYQRKSNDFLYWFRKSFLFNWKIANLEYLLKYFYKKAFTS